MTDRSRRHVVRGSLALAGLALLSGCARWPWQVAPPKVPRVGVLLPYAENSPASLEMLEPFWAGLRELGYVDGQNLSLEYRYSGGNQERLLDLARELARLPLDLIVAEKADAVAAAKEATSTIPIVMAIHSDPLGTGAVASLDRPSGNVTDAAFEAARRAGADGLLQMISDPFIQSQRNRIVEFAAQNRLASMHSDKAWVIAGGLMAYGASYPAIYRRSAYYVDRILKGAQPADLPVEQPTTFELAVNLRTAQALGLTIPHHVLQQTTEVIQ